MAMGNTVRRPEAFSKPIRGVVAYRIGQRVYLNLTSRCSLRCRFCPKFHRTWTVEDAYLRLALADEPRAEDVVSAARLQGACEEYVFCGLGEPTTRLDTLLEVASTLKRGGGHLRLNTDGLARLVHGCDIALRLAGLIDHVSISLNAQNEAVYRRWCRPKLPGSFAAVLAFAERCRSFVPRVTLTAIDGLEGVDIKACAGIARDIGVEFRARPWGAPGGRAFRVR